MHGISSSTPRSRLLMAPTRWSPIAISTLCISPCWPQRLRTSLSCGEASGYTAPAPNCSTESPVGRLSDALIPAAKAQGTTKDVTGYGWIKPGQGPSTYVESYDLWLIACNSAPLESRFRENFTRPRHGLPRFVAPT